MDRRAVSSQHYTVSSNKESYRLSSSVILRTLPDQDTTKITEVTNKPILLDPRVGQQCLLRAAPQDVVAGLLRWSVSVSASVDSGH